MLNYRKCEDVQRFPTRTQLKKTKKSKIFYRLSKILSTFDFPRVRAKARSTRKPGVYAAPGFFFDVVGRQMSFFVIFGVVAAIWHGLAGENIPAAGAFYSE